MTQFARFTVSIPSETLRAVDEILAKDESRSALVRRLLEEALQEEQEREDVEAYIRSYRENPETEEEFGWLDVVVPLALSEIPWE